MELLLIHCVSPLLNKTPRSLKPTLLRNDTSGVSTSQRSIIKMNFLRYSLAQAQRVADYRNGTETHCRACDHWAQQQAQQRVQHAGSYWNSKSVIDKRKEEILPDVAHRGLAEFSCAHNPAQIAFQYRDSG